MFSSAPAILRSGSRALLLSWSHVFMLWCQLALSYYHALLLSGPTAFQDFMLSWFLDLMLSGSHALKPSGSRPAMTFFLVFGSFLRTPLGELFLALRLSCSQAMGEEMRLYRRTFASRVPLKKRSQQPPTHSKNYQLKFENAPHHAADPLGNPPASLGKSASMLSIIIENLKNTWK